MLESRVGRKEQETKVGKERGEEEQMKEPERDLVLPSLPMLANENVSKLACVGCRNVRGYRVIEARIR
jgi:hypothetical protein